MALRNSGEMARSIRTTILLATTVLCGCASVPPDDVPAVAVRTGALSREYSSFNARVLRDASAVDATFTTSLTPGAETFTRLESGYTYQFGDSQDLLRVGDTVSSPGTWGTAVRYGGVQFRSQAAARADVINNAELATTGLAVLPTAADALFAAAGDPGASLSQQSLSVSRTWNTGRIVARDARGRSATITAPVIAQTRLVESGCADVAVGAGRIREDYALTSNDYGPTYANTTVACGVPLGFTVEGHGEYVADEVAAVGIGLARKVPWFGVATMSYASSRADVGTGWRAGFGVEHRTEVFDVALRSRMQSRDFREVGSLVLQDPIMQRNLASIGMKVLDTGSLSLAYAGQTTWDRERMDIIALQQSFSVGRGSLSMSAGHSAGADIGSSVFISYKLPLGFSRPTRSPVQEFNPVLFDSALPVEGQ
jgi:outer membrane usher protein